MSEYFEKINREIGRALVDYSMIETGERVLVAVSGGKDSLCLLHFLIEFQKKAPIPFELLAVNLDQGQPGFPETVLPELFRSWGVPFHIEKQDTYSIVKEKLTEKDTPCSLCSRLRRGILYRIAREKGCKKIALGHHKDDLLQTFLLNAFFAGKLRTMSARYTIESGEIDVIRPLYSVSEEWIESFVSSRGWPIVPCNFCGSRDDLKRQEMEKLLTELTGRFPGLKNSLFGAIKTLL